MYDDILDKNCVTLDELINSLTEAKEHGIDGRSRVLVRYSPTRTRINIENVVFDSNNVTLLL